MPVTSLARSTRPADTAPAVARRTPVKFAIESVFDTRSADVEANEETFRKVEVAFVEVLLIEERNAIDDDAFTLMPMVEVGVSAPSAISHALPKSCEVRAYAERSAKVGRPNEEVASCWYAPPA